MYSYIFILHFSSTLFMLGIIWFVQIIHYPLFERVGSSFFVDYEKEHQRLAGLLIAPIMLIEMFSGICLALKYQSFPFYLSLSLLVFIWCSTFLVQVKHHQALEKGFSESSYRKLVLSNWFRTLLWSLKAAVLIWVLGNFL